MSTQTALHQKKIKLAKNILYHPLFIRLEHKIRTAQIINTVRTETERPKALTLYLVKDSCL